MKMQSIFKRSCIAYTLLILLACGGGGGGDAPAPAPAPVPAPNIAITPSTYSFAGTALYNNVERVFEVRNTGNANLIIGQVSAPNAPFSITSGTCSSATLTPSQTCSLRVRFSPTSQGTFNGAFSISSNAGSVNIPLSGVGRGLNVWVSQVTPNCPSTVTVDVTVTNPANPGDLLTSGVNFSISQNGSSQSINSINNTWPAPVTLVLAIDKSESIYDSRALVIGAATSLINNLGNEDWAAICNFYLARQFFPDPSPLFYEGTPAGKNSLITNINEAWQIISGTALYDAVYESVQRAVNGPPLTQKAVIVISDGVDTSVDGGVGSARTIDQVIADAVQKGIPVFTVFFVDPNYSGGGYGNTLVMQRLAQETGGQYYYGDNANLNDVFRQISTTLNNKYTITYTPSTCSGTVSLDVDASWQTLTGRGSRTVTLP